MLSPDETGLSSQAVPPIPRVPLPVWQDVATVPRLGASPCSSRCSICQLCPLPGRAGLAPDYLCGCVCPLSVPGSRECSVNEYGTFLRLSTPGFLWGPGHLASPDLKRGLCLFFPLTKPNLSAPTPSGSRQSSHWSPPVPLPALPGVPQLSGAVGRGPPCLCGTHTSSPQCSKEQTDPAPPSPPSGQEGSNAPSFADYLFVWRDRNDVKVYLEISISLYIFN